ncbi:hypothetical protein Ahy_B09g095879 isoform B [Arachis hypogaea]|uniref:Uncharacterized protein n=1 Tax=Arachis hypogaea TaxID=3818 RepID=A0A444XI24_ARAHY|nr:hypothetical protein Ahy_B09g095879 isoform B [Arachis hypogaea]
MDLGLFSRGFCPMVQSWRLRGSWNLIFKGIWSFVMRWRLLAT